MFAQWLVPMSCVEGNGSRLQGRTLMVKMAAYQRGRERNNWGFAGRKSTNDEQAGEKGEIIPTWIRKSELNTNVANANDKNLTRQRIISAQGRSGHHRKNCVPGTRSFAEVVKSGKDGHQEISSIKVARSAMVWLYKSLVERLIITETRRSFSNPLLWRKVIMLPFEGWEINRSVSLL
ncbi:hypothetical protein Dimus_015484 [Dionaea muscipula]